MEPILKSHLKICSKTTFLFFVFLFYFSSLAAEKFHFATATDTEHYTWTLNLIGSIHRYHDERLGEIAVYDIGLKEEERLFLNSLDRVTVLDVEKANPYIFEKFPVNKKGKSARGLYSWKPVVIKQALERFEEFFYLDSGITIRGPLDLFFLHVHENGYLFLDCGHSIERMTVQPLVKKFELDTPSRKSILKQDGMSAGIQGLSRTLYQTYSLSLYELANDITNFQDDGSCPRGFGFARHDQTLFSIQARILNLNIQKRSLGKINLKLNDKEKKVLLNDFLSITRKNFDPNKTRPFLRFKKENLKTP